MHWNAALMPANAVNRNPRSKGRRVIIDKNLASFDTKDGVTVMKGELSHPFENMGAQLLKRSRQQNSRCGRWWDNHRHRIGSGHCNGGLKNVAAGANPMDLKRGIDKAVSVVVEQLKTVANHW